MANASLEPLYFHSTATGKLFAAFDSKLAATALAGRLLRSTPATITQPAELEREYKRIQSAGYAKSSEESVEGITGYAIPIRDATGAVAAAIHTSVLTKRATKAHERKMLVAARACAEQIERHLGHVDAGDAHKAG